MSKKNREINCEISTVVPKLPYRTKDYAEFICKVEGTDFGAVYKAFSDVNYHQTFCEVLIQAICEHSRNRLSECSFAYDIDEGMVFIKTIDSEDDEQQCVSIHVDAVGTLRVFLFGKERRYEQLTFKYVATDLAMQFRKSMVKNFSKYDMAEAFHMILTGINANEHKKALWKKQYMALLVHLQESMPDKNKKLMMTGAHK